MAFSDESGFSSTITNSVLGQLDARLDVSIVGHTYTFLKGPDFNLDNYTCPICTHVASNPQQVTCCGHIYCMNCLDVLKKGESSFKCPTCNHILTDRDYFTDKRAQLEINSLIVYCPNNTPKLEEEESCCEWKGELMYVEDHRKSCLYQSVTCECEEKLMLKDLITHKTKHCTERIVQCEYCSLEGPYKDITGPHIDVCPEYSLQCNIEECQEVVVRREMLSHKRKCPKDIIPCEYSTVGCTKRIKREEQEEHNDQCIKEHLQQAVFKVAERNEKVERITEHLCKKKEVFKVPNFSKKKKWWSRSFYSSYRGGYKMETKVYCTEKGDVACYVFLKEGEYDDTLEWPFTGEVLIELLNQLEDKNHFSRILKFCYATPTAKQKPSSLTSNAGWGYCQFLLNNELDFNSSLNRQYLKDDTLYFRVSVKCNPVSTTPWLMTDTSPFEL